MKLSQKLLLAIAVYYINRNMNRTEKRKWHKQGDLDEIAKVCAESNMGYSAISGTFWFSRGKRVCKMTEGSFPNTVTETK